MMNRNLFLLSLTSFLTDLSSEIIATLLPLFLIQIGGGSIALGTLSGLRELVSNLLKPISGKVSDEIKRRKPLVIVGYATSSIFKFLIAVSNSVSQIVIFSALERVGKGIRTAPRDALLSISREKGRSFGIHRSADTAGALLGVISALLLIKSGVTVRSAIFIGALVSVFSLVPLFFLKETQGEIEEKGKGKSEEKPIGKIILVLSLYTFGAVSPMFLIFETGKLLSNQKAVLFYLFLNIAYLIVSYPLGALSDRVGRRKVLFLGYTFTGLSLLLLGFKTTEPFLLLSFVLYGVGAGVTDGVQRALIGDLFKKEKRGTGYGVFQGAMGVSGLLGNLSLGYLLNSLSNTAFVPFSLVCFLSAVSILRIERES
jgi:MFS family permease